MQKMGTIRRPTGCDARKRQQVLGPDYRSCSGEYRFIAKLNVCAGTNNGKKNDKIVILIDCVNRMNEIVLLQ